MSNTVKLECYFRPDPKLGDRVGLRIMDGRKISTKAEMPLSSPNDIVRVFETMGRRIATMVEEKGKTIVNANGGYTLEAVTE